MKKHELLKHAYDNYPKGVLCRFNTAKKNYHISNGIFHVTEDGKYIMGGDNFDCFYDEGEWAEIVIEKQSILSGKCAIQVTNEREFKLLMNHYDGKFWSWNGGSGVNTSVKLKYPTGISYEDDFMHWYKESDEEYTLISFQDFAKEVGIEVPLFVMKSEDGVDLYEGDIIYHATNRGFLDRWKIHTGYVIKHMLDECYVFNISPEKDKAFSTKQAAEKWCQEQNKPKVLECKLFGTKTAFINIHSITIVDGLAQYKLQPSDLEDMLHNYKQLNPDKADNK